MLVEFVKVVESLSVVAKFEKGYERHQADFVAESHCCAVERAVVHNCVASLDDVFEQIVLMIRAFELVVLWVSVAQIVTDVLYSPKIVALVGSEEVE